jgi:hypothetical protein
MQLQIILTMKKILLALALVSSQLHAHGGHAHSHGPTDQALTGASIFWNGYEIFTHLASFAGLGSTSCCSNHASKTYHAIEVIGHTSNLYGGVSHFMEAYTTPLMLSGLSLAFNTWAAHSQYQSLQSRGVSAIGIILAPMAALDLWGHTVSAYVAARELVGI